MTVFNQVKNETLERLGQYVPIVARVHGGNHPEFKEVEQLFNALHQKITAAGTAKPALTEEFTSLRRVTDNYRIPADTCESYEAVYTMLAKLDQAYGG